MKKKVILLLVTGFALAGCGKKIKIIDYKDEGYTMKALDAEKVTVTFYKNIGKEELDLNSGMYASTTTTALKVDVIAKNEKAVKPEVDPMRVNYDFTGWHTREVENSPYDFESPVTKNLVLYAHWEQNHADEDFVEPEYVEPSHIDDTIETLVSITGVLNIPLSGTTVQLSKAGMSRLNRTPSDVKDVLNYKIKTGVTLTASYNGSNTISYNATKEGAEPQAGTITVQDISASLKLTGDDVPLSRWWESNEPKAVNYENNDVDFEDHRIMLAGSSSMENWSNSGTDLLPLHTYNHGIGGTIVEQWQQKLNQRLVYPYSPKILVYYLGVNNIIQANPVSVETTGNDLVAMFDDVHAHLPNTHIYYVLINELPSYRDKQAQFDAVNQYAKNYESTHSYLTTINAGKDLLKANGEPNQAYFLNDGLHMSLAGYAIWGKIIKNRLIQDLRNA